MEEKLCGMDDDASWTAGCVDGCVVTTADTEVGRGRQRQKFFTTLYGRHLRRAIKGMIKVDGKW